MKRILVFGLFFAVLVVAILLVTGRPVNGSVFETPIYSGQENQAQNTQEQTTSGATTEQFCSTLFTRGQQVQYRRTDGTTTFLRSEPSRNSDVVARISEGTRGQIIGAPVCAGDFTWWNISVNGKTGWTAESTNTLGYLLESAN
jgi:hypothetical protein